MFTSVARRGRIGCRRPPARVGLLVAVLCSAWLVAFPVPSGAARSQSPQSPTPLTSEHISVVQTPSGLTGMCLPPVLSLRQFPSSDATTFRLRIEVNWPLCAPLLVTAAIYRMPDDGSLWPQRLLETVPFTLDGTGVTEVTFTKPCMPAQFDVVTGETPTEISPLGVHHGPMLFPFDMETAMQSPGCGPSPVVPEAPLSLLLPISALAVLGGVGLVTVRRRRAVPS